MAKPNPLSAVAAQVAESMEKAQDTPQPVALASYTPEPAPAAPAKTSREGKRFLGYYVEPTRHEEIKQAALDEGIQIQELIPTRTEDHALAQSERPSIGEVRNGLSFVRAGIIPHPTEQDPCALVESYG